MINVPRKGFFIGVSIAIIVIAVLTGIILTREGKNPPNFKIMGHHLDEMAVGPAYLVYVYVTVKNEGGPGSATVYVTVMQGEDSWTKSKSIYLDSGESKNLTFWFGVREFNSISYKVWIG